MPSPFLTPGAQTQLDSLALLHLRRDHTIPAVLSLHDDQNLGYDEGKVANTRYGSYPHSTLHSKPWGSQIIASKVDTGSRGRRPAEEVQRLKRKAEELEAQGLKPEPKAPVAADSGFLHLLAPTPELWTASLPHRTQVVYTPDYSYILHRLCVRPGSTIIEAGAGSGSFTHASVRATFNGYPSDPEQPSKKRRLGKVCSFEFHEQRAGKIREEVRQHGLEGLVEVTHRDVYEDGFLLAGGASPKANAVFLDLPAPWNALKHLVRSPASGAESPLDPASPIYICTFSPCLEQAQRTISTLRQLGWLAISMVEVNHRRIEVKRERYGLEYEGQRGAMIFPKSVDEAVAKMRSVEERSRKFNSSLDRDSDDDTPLPPRATEEQQKKPTPTPLPQQPEVPLYKQGRLQHRSEMDLKTHTSYLVFAILPRDWTEEDEQKCREKWPSSQVKEPPVSNSRGKRQLKREEKERRRQEYEKRTAKKAEEAAAAAAAAGEGEGEQQAAKTDE